MKILKNTIVTSALFCLLLTSLLIIGCGNNSTKSINPVLPIDDINKVPSIIEIDGVDFELSAYLWRDYMPTSQEDGTDMAAVVYISTTDYTEFPADVDADKLWVIDNNNIWEAYLSNKSQPDNNFRIKKSASGGPKWQTGIKVDVVVRLFNAVGEQYYIKALGVTINRTD